MLPNFIISRITNSVLYVLLENIDIILLKLTRLVKKAIGSSEDYLGIAD